MCSSRSRLMPCQLRPHQRTAPPHPQLAYAMGNGVHPPTAPCCEIRTLVLHTYPDGIKAFGHERITTPMGRRGKPVRKLRLIPAERAYAWARKLQGTPSTTVSVL